MTAVLRDDALQRAIAWTGAVVVRVGITETIIGGDGRGPDVTRSVRSTLYAFRPSGLPAYVVTDEQDLYDAQIEADRCWDNDVLPYLQRERSMQPWWSPEQREAWFVAEFDGKLGATPYASYDDAVGFMRRTSLGHHVARITADLETGAEGPA